MKTVFNILGAIQGALLVMFLLVVLETKPRNWQEMAVAFFVLGFATFFAGILLTIATDEEKKAELLRQRLGQGLRTKYDASESALQVLKKLTGDDQVAKNALGVIGDLRATVRCAAEELDPSIKAVRIREELADPPEYKLGRGPKPV